MKRFVRPVGLACGVVGALAALVMLQPFSGGSELSSAASSSGEFQCVYGATSLTIHESNASEGVIFSEAVMLSNGVMGVVYPLIVQVGEATRPAIYLGTNAEGEPWYDCPVVCHFDPWVERYLAGEFPAPIILDPDACQPIADNVP